MKKLFLSTAALILIFATYYLVFSSPEKQKESEVFDSEQETHSPQEVAAIQNHKRKDFTTEVEETGRKEDNRRIPPEEKNITNVLSEEQLDELESYFDEVEKEWEAKMEALIIEKLRLSIIELQAYRNVREKYEQEKLKAYQDFYARMEAQYGENFTVSPSEEADAIGEEIQEHYNRQLQTLFGEEGFQEYVKTREEYNERLRMEQDPKIGTMLIDF